MTLGYPKFVYRVPDEPWMVVITSNAIHFYFNEITKQSCWQLSDLPESSRIAKKIDYDSVLVLCAKARGLRIETENGSGKKQRSDGKTKKNVVNDKTVEDILTKHGYRTDKQENKEENEVENEVEHEIEHEENDININSDLIKDEGDRNHEDIIRVVGGTEEAVGDIEELHKTEHQIADINELQEQSHHKNEGINLGYGSDSEPSDDDQDTLLKPESIASDIDQSEGNTIDETNTNQGLDLSISDEETSNEAEKNEFMQLLDSLKDQISIYDPWFLVNEELISSFATSTSYFALTEKEREDVFNEWVLNQNAVEIVETKENSTAEYYGIEVKYPTLKQRFFDFLQKHKEAARKHYADFKKIVKDELDEFLEDLGGDLTVNTRESIFRQYNAMIQDLRAFSKDNKMKFPGENMKVVRLRQHLQSRLKINPLKPKSEEFATHMARLLDEKDDDSKKDGDFNDIWYLICNFHEVPNLVAESPWNYALGPQKRAQTYLEYISKR